MNLTKDPRCPVHPDHDVMVVLRAQREQTQWACCACGRILGLQSFGLAPGAPPPRGRKATPRLMTERATDDEWLSRGFDISKARFVRRGPRRRG
jgi:hypothetical protein